MNHSFPYNRTAVIENKVTTELIGKSDVLDNTFEFLQY